MLKDKTILLGVSGGIAAYKAAFLASLLVKQDAIVRVLMTQNAGKFVSPLTFETLVGSRVAQDTFDPDYPSATMHIDLAKQAQLVLIAPATANIIAKLANGIADDMLTSTVLASTCPKLIAPAMNTHMWQNPVTQANIERLRHFDWKIIEPGSGRLACGDIGEGKMAEAEELLDAVLQEIAYEKDLAGWRILVTAGPTREAIDPVRFLTNYSSGKMGYAIARAASLRGAQVTLVTGQTALPPPPYMDIVSVSSAADMFEAVISRSEKQDVIIKAAAVADFRPQTTANEKVKKTGEDNLSIPLARTQDILKYLGEHKPKGQFLCGFSMETENMIENSKKKLENKHLDLIACNNLKDEGSGFIVGTTKLTLISSDDEIVLPLLDKTAAAHRLLDEIVLRRKA
ncbi:MAG TPA: bifunctional phosphopantothenoylcysteine decarboxylase/phosphopantothenate--cysteine ligase CoaBC [Clostridiales bacterium]|jgi:phosphopantothenoylcysteine decarboxylase/phosphopantothenate--cysteine ligase|nr:bifunctional phosphopantothenoylcysteine decarboxylase/phosphopantothenate--cysteine ligase CoaBC [Clostridiales bacterium]